jgi:hypothetical protein
MADRSRLRDLRCSRFIGLTGVHPRQQARVALDRSAASRRDGPAQTGLFAYFDGPSFVSAANPPFAPRPLISSPNTGGDFDPAPARGATSCQAGRLRSSKVLIGTAA